MEGGGRGVDVLRGVRLSILGVFVFLRGVTGHIGVPIHNWFRRQIMNFCLVHSSFLFQEYSTKLYTDVGPVK